MTNNIDRDGLRQKDIAYLGWWLEGEPGPAMAPASYLWYATEHKGSGLFTVTTEASRSQRDRREQYEEAAQAGLAAAKGKIFLGTWRQEDNHLLHLPVEERHVRTLEIRQAVLLGLYRLYERGFEAGDFQIDLEGVGVELAVSQKLVLTAVEFLYDKGRIGHYGTLGRDWRTGDIFLSADGVEYVESLPTAEQRHQAAAATGMRAILFMDIADSTSLTEKLGDSAFRTLSRQLDRALRTTIAEAGGTPIQGKVLGDGVMATFTSARQAVECALRCNAAAAKTNLRLHQGMHVGDVIDEGDNVYGGAVNIAARIASASAPGEILVSDTVRSIGRTSTDVIFEDRGEHTLKGVGEALRLYEILKADQTEPEPPAAKRTRIAPPPGLLTHVREAKRVGGEDDPGVYAAVVVENPQGENAFVDHFEVEMLAPFRAQAIRLKYRSTPTTPIDQLALNVPGRGISDQVVVIATFDQILPYESECTGRIAALGRKGLRKRWRQFTCPALT